MQSVLSESIVKKFRDIKNTVKTNYDSKLNSLLRVFTV